MNFFIDTINKNEYHKVVDVWEASVRATHHFLKEEDIEYFKPLILNEYLDVVDLRCVRDLNREMVGFIGLADQTIEMLFVHPEMRGKGIGKLLMNFAFKEFKVDKVDVNEDNFQALGFYEHLGFEIVGRSELDGSGKPYPILHLEQNSKKNDFT